MEWVTPNKIIVCLYESHNDSEFAKRIRKLWNEGVPLPPDMLVIRAEHMRHLIQLPRQGIEWARGPFVDSSGAPHSGGLSLLSVNDIDDAKKAMDGDPYFTKVHYHYGAEYHEWIIYIPTERASPSHKEKLESDLKKIGIIPPKNTPEWITPEKLFVCVHKSSPSHAKRLKKLWDSVAALPDEIEVIRNEHLRYVYNLGEKGIIWAAGPFADYSGGLSIYAVSSEEEARKARREDPFYKSGFVHDDVYHEWVIHDPPEKASASHKEQLIKGFLKAGIKI